ncbi:WYL domain-containing protein [Streptomyces cavourensis]
MVAWDLDRADWRTFRADRITPRTPTGPRFTPREVPGGSVAAFITARFRGIDATGAAGEPPVAGPAGGGDPRPPRRRGAPPHPRGRRRGVGPGPLPSGAGLLVVARTGRRHREVRHRYRGGRPSRTRFSLAAVGGPIRGSDGIGHSREPGPR